MLEALAAAGGDLAGTLLSGSLNRKAARQQMAFQERMSNTQYQRAAKDLEAAGLNRVLAIGSPASSPSGSMGSTSPSSPGTTFQQASSAKSQRNLLAQQATNVQADTNKKVAEGDLLGQQQIESEARTRLTDTQAALAIAHELESRARLPTYTTSMDLQRAQASSARAQAGLTRQSTETEKHNTRLRSDSADVLNVASRGAQVVSPILDYIYDEILAPIGNSAKQLTKDKDSWFRPGGLHNFKRDLRLK